MQKVAGIKRYLARTKTTEELETLATTTFASATEEVTITTHNVDGAGASGVVSMPKWLLLQAIEEVLAEGTTGRQLCSVIDRSAYFPPI
ncbi:MAG: hypothetical protein FGM22_08225 [Burkholderiaceae bacterium]|nr:hypothetical protein [Burkholderiaceae bacterium]